MAASTNSNPMTDPYNARIFSFTQPNTQQGLAKASNPNADLTSVPNADATASTPANLSASFPTFQNVTFPTIKPAPYNMTDPQTYANKIAANNQDMISQNFKQAQGMGLSTIDTELQGLQNYATGASDLKRNQTALDNPFNQGERTKQLYQTMPEVMGDLNAQRSRANTYASGQLPNSAQDRALELGIRSNAADSASFSGFGPQSGQASKLSDLMSADQRFQISQYGDSLLNQNISTKANLELAPTEYSNAGTQVSVTPPVDAASATLSTLGQLNNATILTPAAALTAQIGQDQFKTNLDQQTRMFNATGTYDASKFNSMGNFTAGLGLFNYQAGLANTNAATQQGVQNAASGMQIAGVGQTAVSSGVGAAQASQTTQATAAGTGAIPGALNTVQTALADLGISSAPTPTSDATSGTTQQATKLTPDRAKTEVAPLTDSNVSSGMPSVASSPSMLMPYGANMPAASTVPQGYTAVSKNSDGTTSVAKNSDYEAELDRFSKANNKPSGSITIQNAAKADMNLSQSTALSYVPIPGFQPIATTASGKQVYALPAMAQNGDSTLGQKNVANVGIMAASFGTLTPDTLGALRDLHGAVSDPGTLAQLDKLAGTEGGHAVAAAIMNKIAGKSPDLSTDAGQQLAFGASRIGDIWGNLSPAQKSMALASLTGPALQARTGKNMSDELVPGSQNSPAGALRVGDLASLAVNGTNAHALARNWDQLSAIGSMTTGSNGAMNIARLSDAMGLLGHGPEGSAVETKPGQLAKLGAQPMPEAGVGAMAFKNKSDVPKNYKSVAQAPGGKTIAVPANLAHTSPFTAAGPAQLAYSKAQLVGTGQHPAQKLWGESKVQARGHIGGSALLAGLDTMAVANPTLLGSIVAHSTVNNTHGRE